MKDLWYLIVVTIRSIFVFIVQSLYNNSNLTLIRIEVFMKSKKVLLIIPGLFITLFLISIIGLLVQNAKPQVALGVNDGLFNSLPESPNCVSSQTDQSDKYVEPLAFKETLQVSKEHIIIALEAYGDIEIIEMTDTYIYAVATTEKMKFHDDIEIYFDDETSMVHYRSSSRAGYSDMGLNRDRYKMIKALYQEQ